MTGWNRGKVVDGHVEVVVAGFQENQGAMITQLIELVAREVVLLEVGCHIVHGC